MSMLSDKEILELNELCSALIDGRLTEAQKERLEWWLRNSESARRFYARMMGLSASLHHYASEMHAEAPAPARVRAGFPRLFWVLAPAAAVVSAAVVAWLLITGLPSSSRKPAPQVGYVARLTGVKDCKWRGAAAALPVGSMLRNGQQIELASGYAEITFDSGAQLVLEGPAELEVISPWRAVLRSGTLKANVPPEAIGFTVGCDVVDVLDLGTEFTLRVDKPGTADLMVLKGQVEAIPSAGVGQEEILLAQNEARRFTRWGIFLPPDVAQKFANVVRPILFERASEPVELVNWSFDEIVGELFRARSYGTSLGQPDATVQSPSEWGFLDQCVTGVFGRALSLDGELYVKAPFKGISERRPLTVMFWVRVPQDAPLWGAYAMVAWWVNNPKLGSRPIHIGWNRNAHEGPIGALRTDYAGGYALGTTPLRDGRWHHVAVVLVPGPDPAAPLCVKQYVDGRLDGEGRPSPPGGVAFTEPNTVVNDILWIGCRLGATGPRKDRFLGEIDELWVALHALGPQAIVRIMRENQPALAELAQANCATESNEHRLYATASNQ